MAIYSIENRNREPIVVRRSVDDQSKGKRVESLGPNGLYYAFTDDRAQKVRLLDVSSPLALEAPLEGNLSDVLKLSFDPRGEFLTCADKSEIIVWSTKDHTKKSSIPLPPGYPINKLKELAVSPGGRYVSATSSSGETRLWDTHSNDHTDVIIPFDDATSISFSPDGSRLAIRDPESDHISVWKLNVRDPLLEGTVSASYDFAFTFDNSNLVVNEGGVFVERFDASWALEHVCYIVKRNLTPGERDKYLSGFDHVQACPS